ncbi:hypothetical protein [Mesorhizobium sp.]|uniref:hypothetical protein n=1 Tax=Mesorhizobium sp. TaxID=1871066 RepID=UPI0025E48E78|nr:hypothetical protein [Mesorhizobium sp.]
MRKALLGAAIVLASALPATAQTGNQPENPKIENCEVKPDAAKKDNGGQQDAQSDNLSGSLAPCGGVLKPPPTGDRNATQPPANGSDMPVIKPGQVPPQTAK